MQPYPNQNYFSQYPQYQYGTYNPMMSAQQRMQQLEQQYPQFSQQSQQYGQQNVSTGLIGKVVANADSIIPNDVPMDGRAAFFPKQDMSEIYSKSWNANGTIKTVIYRPVQEDGGNGQSSELNGQIRLSDEAMGKVMKRFDELSEEIDKIGKSLKGSPKVKKESGGKADE